MNKVIVGVGIPGSGKTTALKSFAERNGYAYVSPDDIRTEFTGNAIDQSKNAEVWNETYLRTMKELGEGHTIVVDATFTNSKQRADFLAFARKNGAEKIQGIFVDTPIEIAKERNSARDRVIPEYAIDRMAKNLYEHPPEIEEGFDSIFTIDEYQQLKEAETMSEGELRRKSFK